MTKARTVLAAVALALAAVTPAAAGAFQNGMTALNRDDYVMAGRFFWPLAQAGDARAQAIIAYMFANGRGVPQSYIEAAIWYRRASEQGDPNAQYMLGLMYDRAQGVPQDYVEAYKWLNLATSQTGGRTRQDWVRIRDAVASKLSLVERTEGQRRALEWRPVRER
jgi:TPR repeat protein